MKKKFSALLDHVLLYVLATLSLVYILFTAPIFIQKKHSIFNLEPYPDGMLYALSARNAAMGRGLFLRFQDSSIKFWVPSLYAQVLTPAYLINAGPTAFYGMNLILGLATIVGIIYLVWQTTRSFLATATSGIVFLLHAYVYWIPTLPMAENLSIFLFTYALVIIFIDKKQKTLHRFFLFLLTISLCLTKNLLLIPAIALLLMEFKTIKLKIPTKWGVGIFIGIALICLVYAMFLQNFFVGLFRTLQSEILAVISNTNPYFSVSFILKNLISYGRGLFGFSSPFLWQHTPLSSFCIMFFGPATLLALSFTKKELAPIWKERSIIWTFLFLAKFPVILLFYVSDLRYISTSLSMLAIACGWSMALLAKTNLAQRRGWWLVGAFVILLASHILTQRTLFKEIIRANIFGSTTGWQQQSILELQESILRTTTQNTIPDTFLITALPPFLYDAYAPTMTHHLLPLSKYQEFISKGEWVWGSAAISFIKPNKSTGIQFHNTTQTGNATTPQTFQTEDLFQLYDGLLLAKKTVFVSNAYITHQQSVITDFEKIKARYSLELISTGCLNACNLYKLSLKN